MFEKEILWLEVILLVKSPVSILGAPLRILDYRECTAPFLDCDRRGIPSRSCLEPPPLFADKSFCLIQKLLELDIDHPQRCIFLKKKGTHRGKAYWFTEYSAEFQSCLTPVKITRANHAQTAKKTVVSNQNGNDRKPSALPEGYESDSPDVSERNETLGEDDVGYSDDDRADDLAFWLAEEDWVFRSDKPNDTVRTGARARLPPQEIDFLHGILTGVVDESKYYIVVNSLTSILTVRWRYPERDSHWGRFNQSKELIDAQGGKKFNSSSSSSLSLHSHSACVMRAKRWCAWHASWIYDIRPVGQF